MRWRADVHVTAWTQRHGSRVASPRSVCVLILLLHAVGSPVPASASPLIELLGGNLGSGGFNARAAGASAASSYFNPALLPQADQGLELGWFILNDAISVRLDARDTGVDVPAKVISTSKEMFPVPTTWLDNGCEPNPTDENTCRSNIPPQPRQSDGSSGNTRLYQVVGFVNHVVDERWTLGVYSLVRIGSLLNAHSFFADEREQYFTNSLHPELYSDRLTPMSLAFATGLKVVDWLSVGLSFTLNLSNDAQATSYVSNPGNLGETLLLSTRVDSSIGMAPHFSVLLEPIDTLDISVVLHTPQKLEIVADAVNYTAIGELSNALRTNVHSWLPLTLSLGLSYRFYETPSHVLSVVGTGMYRGWSEYQNRQGERPLPGYEWADTAAGSLGVRYSYVRELEAFLDVTYEPSPVPLQTGRTNYVDNDRTGLAGGVSYTWAIEDWDVSLRLGAQAQFHILRERHQRKIDPRVAGASESLVIDEFADDAVDVRTLEPLPEAQGLQTNNPGWPGFSSSGTLMGGLLNVGLLY